MSSSGVAFTASSRQRVGALDRLDEEHLQARAPGPCRAARTARTPISTVIASASSGEASDIARDGCGRASSLSMRPPPSSALRPARPSRPAHPLADLLDRGLARSARAATGGPRAMTTSRSQISNSSSSSSLTTSTRSRRRAARAARRGSARRRRRRRPRSAARRPAASGSASISRPTMNFCRLPPDRLLRRRVRARRP